MFLRFIKVEEIREPKLIVVVGSLGLVVNIIGLFLFHRQYCNFLKPYIN